MRFVTRFGALGMLALLAWPAASAAEMRRCPRQRNELAPFHSTPIRRIRPLC
jgi:hypothetical protein